LTGVGLAIGSFALAGCLHGNGFVAAFVAGLAFRVRDDELRGRIHSYGATHADQLALILFMVFGATSLPAAALDARAWGYALASLFLVRGAAIALSLIGTGTDRHTVLFLGWFGPRGLASILFATIVTEAAGFVELERVLGVVRLTVGLSIVLHGLSAIPLSRRLARKSGASAA
jgi:NhaP-type Na+/H+ or K+/H+ antiporter